LPELPEVEIHARLLRQWLMGRRIERAEVLDPKLLPDLGDPERLAGRGVLGVRRTAKYLMTDLDGGLTMTVHLRMTGKLVREGYVAAPPVKASRLLLDLDDGSRVRFDDFRRFGRVWLCATADVMRLPELAALGPDALLEPTSAGRLREVTARTARAIKALLMDQTVIGGIGNICAAEILYRAGVAPETPSRALSDAQVEAIAREIVPFLQWSVETQARSELIYLGEPGAENVFTVYGRRGEPCPRCGTAIARAVVGGRGTYSCPGCQSPGRS
jgi:formamidopyrimidine-DNA glycosylase